MYRFILLLLATQPLAYQALRDPNILAPYGDNFRSSPTASPTEADPTQHCILYIGVHIARYMSLLHLARNAHLARIARNMHDYVICADCARHAPVMQNYDRFLALRAMCTSSKFTIVRNMRIVSKWAYCAPCALRYAHYMHICRTPPRSCFIVSTIVVHDWGFCGQ